MLLEARVLWRIKGLTIKNERKRQRKVEKSPEGLANSKCRFFNGFSHSAVVYVGFYAGYLCRFSDIYSSTNILQIPKLNPLLRGP